MTLDLEICRRAPKVLLHDHLDGGLRPATVAELAAETGYEGLPTSDVAELATWFRDAADSGSLVRYLETFAHTVGVMQTEDALRRVARECVLDLAADGIVYAEVRFAPELHTQHGVHLEQAVEAVLAGFADGERAAADAGTPIVVRALLTAMRTAARSTEIAELVVRYRDQGVVGFDIAGAEEGYPPTRHLDAFEYLRRENAHFTIHAGEAFGLPSIWEAIQWCGAGAAASIATHPLGLLRTLGFRVTVNTDNRLMSDTTLSREMQLLSEAFGYDLADLQWLAINAMKSAFLPFDQRLRIINEVIKPGYAAMVLADLIRG